MKWGQLLLCGWPGLVQLWLRGSFFALIIAIGFSLVLNLALVSTFLWPALLGDQFPVVVWPVIFLLWTTSAWISVNAVERLSGPPKMSSEQERNDFSAEKSGINAAIVDAEIDEVPSHTLFNRAQREYLLGHWTEAETLLKRRLDEAERDIEARLLLATLFRHTEKLDSASCQLDQMEKLDDSVHWKFEIQRERQLIDQNRYEQDNNHSFSDTENE